MKRTIKPILLCIAALLMLLSFGGCGTPSSINMSDLNAVNQYIENSTESIVLSVSEAEDLNKYIYQNRNTKEIKTCWELVVDYIHNITSDDLTELDYSIVFYPDDLFSLEDADQPWEMIGY